MPETFLDPVEVADQFSISLRTVYTNLRNGKLIGHKDEEGVWRVRPKDAQKFMDAHYGRTVAPPQHRPHRATAALIPDDYAQRVVNVRKRHCFTQPELGAKIGASARAVYQWEAGKRTPWPKFWRKIIELE